MNQNHLRPLLAFGCLAAAAVVISGVGLRAGTTAVPVRAGTPAPVVGATSSDLVLGGALSPTAFGSSAASATELSAGSLGLSAAWGSSTAREHAVVVAINGGTDANLARTDGGSTGSTGPGAAAGATQSPSGGGGVRATASTGHGKGHGKGHHPRPVKATPTVRPGTTKSHGGH